MPASTDTAGSAWRAPRREGGRGGRRAPRSLLARLALALLAVLAGGAVLLAVAVGLLIGAAPAVDDARERVDALLARGGGAFVELPRDARLSRAVVAVEDHRFYDHDGVDPLALARVAWRGLTDPSADAAGSTISLQLAKVLYTGESHSVGDALAQVGTALRLERGYGKDELLNLYLNGVYLGDGRYGVDSASRHYLGRGPAELTWGQASLLAGLPQWPSRYSRDLDAARRRQRHVLDRLVATSQLTPAEAGAAFAEPLPRFERLAG